MQWIAFQVTGCREWIFHKPGVVERANGFVVRNTRGNDFASAGITGHEVRLHQSGRDFYLCIHQQAVEADRHLMGCGKPQRHAARLIARVMVNHLYVLLHPRIAKQFLEFVAEIGAMQASGNQHRNAGLRHSGRSETFDQRPQKETMGHRAGNVTNEYARGFSTVCQRFQSVGTDRGGECRFDDVLARGCHRNGRFADHCSGK